MAKVTYLLGAGASANALPVLKETNRRLLIFKSYIDRFLQDTNGNDEYKSYEKASETLRVDIQYVLDSMSSHLTVDTYARKLFAREILHKDLRKLKRVLSSYFVFEQLPINMEIKEAPNQKFKQIPDKRYDSLIASLLSYNVDNLSLANDVKILSWNYDIQFEAAYMLFTGRDTLKETHETLQIVPGKWLKDNTIDLERFSLVHLNGVAGYKNLLDDKEKTRIDEFIRAPQKNIQGEERNQMVAGIVKYYDELTNYESYGATEPEEVSYFNYCWEYKSHQHSFVNPFGKQTNDCAKSIAKQTEILVVIGYSFPIFNRWYDNELIEAMAKLEKVYIQDKEAEQIETIMKNGFKAFQPPYHKQHSEKDFFLSSNVDQFIIPSELSL